MGRIIAQFKTYILYGVMRYARFEVARYARVMIDSNMFASFDISW